MDARNILVSRLQHGRCLLSISASLLVLKRWASNNLCDETASEACPMNWHRRCHCLSKDDPIRRCLSNSHCPWSVRGHTNQHGVALWECTPATARLRRQGRNNTSLLEHGKTGLIWRRRFRDSEQQSLRRPWLRIEAA